MQGFTLDEGLNISCLAFADDLILLADTKDKAEIYLHSLERFLNDRGMAIEPSKCATFEIKTTGKSWHIDNPNIKTRNGIELTYHGPTTPITYLGIQISPWVGATCEEAIKNLRDSLPRIKRLVLKAHQKIELLAGYTIPHFLYPLAMAPICATQLKLLDRDIRVTIKECLHLPLSTADGFLYTRKKDGGLRFPRLETIVIATALKAGWNFGNNDDPIMTIMWPQSGIESKTKKLAHSAHLGWPIRSLTEINKYKERQKAAGQKAAGQKAAEQKAWESLSSQGKGVAAYKDDRIGNSFLYRHTLLKPTRYISALKLRANVAGNKVSISRAAKSGDVLCRQCKVQLETLGHILGQCINTKKSRISRHNEIRDVIESRIANRTEVCKEMQIQDTDGNRLQPDLVIHDGGRVLVAEVTVCHEDGDLLTIGKQEKLVKYAPLKFPLLEKFKGVIPIVIGTRGTMPKDTIKSLKTIGIEDRSTLTTLSMIALRSSIEIYHTFLDYDKRGLRQRNRIVPS